VLSRLGLWLPGVGSTHWPRSQESRNQCRGGGAHSHGCHYKENAVRCWPRRRKLRHRGGSDCPVVQFRGAELGLECTQATPSSLHPGLGSGLWGSGLYDPIPGKPNSTGLSQRDPWAHGTGVPCPGSTEAGTFFMVSPPSVSACPLWLEDVGQEPEVAPLDLGTQQAPVPQFTSARLLWSQSGPRFYQNVHSPPSSCHHVS
jgi:hypothetical protein